MFSYAPLWQLLVEKNLNKEEFRKAVKLSSSTVAKMGKNENVSMYVIERICEYFDCGVEQVMKYISVQKLVFEFVEMKQIGEIIKLDDLERYYKSYNIPAYLIEQELISLKDKGLISVNFSMSSPEVQYKKVL
ncbi:MAG TPA: helix-turn-helix transcriptional regulator [Bacillus sp. (in: firmicutes)]|nr:helix-turn-helix transcriptional regulator [Bacillus sp. (in: firmicutes)]